MPTVAPRHTTPLYALLHDLHANGLTDLTAPTPYNWTSTPPRPQRAPTTKNTPAHSAPTPQKTAVPVAAKPTPEDTKLDPATAIRTYPAQEPQNDAPLTILTAALPTQLAGNAPHPFTSNEYTLLTNILTALNINIKHVNFMATTATDDTGTPLTPSQISALHNAAQTQLNGAKPQKILALGQLATSVFITGTPQPLPQLRTQQPQAKTAPTITTYHPRALLKTPSLKQRTWQDLQKFVTP